MGKKNTVLDLICSQGVLPLYYHQASEVSIEVLRTLYGAGIRTLEYTNRGTDALNNFKKMKDLCNREMKDMYLGIGTVKNAETVRQYIIEGADYIISPGMVAEVAEVADKHNVPYIPGCMTPSEIIAAENLGIKMIKLFPGNVLGPAFMSSIKSVFPDLLFMPTGGVDVDEGNIRSWFNAGVNAVGMGSKLISKDLLAQRDYDKIGTLTKKTLEIVNKVRG